MKTLTLQEIDVQLRDGVFIEIVDRYSRRLIAPIVYSRLNRGTHLRFLSRDRYRRYLHLHQAGPGLFSEFQHVISGIYPREGMLEFRIRSRKGSRQIGC